MSRSRYPLPRYTVVTGDDFQLNGHENIVSIKTHYPSSEGTPLPGADSIPRAILLIRNPLYSIPSYFNFVYEFQNNLPGEKYSFSNTMIMNNVF